LRTKTNKRHKKKKKIRKKKQRFGSTALTVGKLRQSAVDQPADAAGQVQALPRSIKRKKRKIQSFWYRQRPTALVSASSRDWGVGC
jgi:hypothetical protein